MRALSLWVLLITAPLLGGGSKLADGKLADGLYAVLTGTPGAARLLYRFDLAGSAAEVLLFISTYGGKWRPAPENGEEVRLLALEPKPLPVRWQIGGYAVLAGVPEWSPPQQQHSFPPSSNPFATEGAAVLAFWQQRQQVRSDILLLTYPVDLYQSLQHRAFAIAVGKPFLSGLVTGMRLHLSELVAIGTEARAYLERYRKDELGLGAAPELWQNWLMEHHPEVAELVTRENFVRDAYGFYLLRGQQRGGMVAAEGANVEFSFRYQSLQFADLQGNQSGVALVGRDRLLPVVDYFLRHIPPGESWTVLVPPWLNQGPEVEQKDASWYRYTITVNTVF